MRVTSPWPGIGLLTLAGALAAHGCWSGRPHSYVLACFVALAGVLLISARPLVLAAATVTLAAVATTPLGLRPDLSPSDSWQRLDLSHIEAVKRSGDRLLIDTGSSIQLRDAAHRRVAAIPVDDGQNRFWAVPGGDVVVAGKDAGTVARYTAEGHQRWRASDATEVVAATSSTTVTRICDREKGCSLQGLDRTGEQVWDLGVKALSVSSAPTTGSSGLPATIVLRSQTEESPAGEQITLIDADTGQRHSTGHSGSAVSVSRYTVLAVTDDSDPLTENPGLVGYRDGKKIWSVPENHLPDDDPRLSVSDGTVSLDRSATVDPRTGTIREIADAPADLDDGRSRTADVTHDDGGVAVVSDLGSRHPYVSASDRKRHLRLTVFDPKSGDEVFSTVIKNEPYRLFLPRPGLVILAGADVRTLTYDPPETAG